MLPCIAIKPLGDLINIELAMVCSFDVMLCVLNFLLTLVLNIAAQDIHLNQSANLPYLKYCHADRADKNELKKLYIFFQAHICT